MFKMTNLMNDKRVIRGNTYSSNMKNSTVFSVREVRYSHVSSVMGPVIM